jgi:hypothetical protein
MQINRQALHGFWTETYREKRRRELRLALVCFLLVVCLLMGLGLALDKQAPDASWDGSKWTCPAPYSVYADEHDALAGKDFVYCVK